MLPSDKAVSLIANLLRLTQQGKLRWKPTSLSLASGDVEKLAGTAFVTRFEGRELRLYPYQYEGEYYTRGLLARGGPYHGWMTAFRLDILDTEDHVLYSLTDVQGMSDLMDAIRLSVSGVDELIQKLERA